MSVQGLTKKQLVLLGVIACLLVGLPVLTYLVGKTQIFEQQASSLPSEDLIPDIAPFLFSHENRVDIDGNGSWDSYITDITQDQQAKMCGFSLRKISDKSLIWKTFISGCEGYGNIPVFHTRSFMGNEKKDFTWVIKMTQAVHSYTLAAGDGATGAFRGFGHPLIGYPRLKGIQVVDFQLPPPYQGPALFIRGSSENKENLHGYLYYFPKNSGVVDLTFSRWGGAYPFPGIDLPGTKYTELYNTFHQDLPKCGWNDLTVYANQQCGLPDTTTDVKDYGSYFLDQVNIGDIDADSVEDILMTYLWKDVVYSGRPKGNVANLGAPQYEHAYSPQNDNNGCHSGRHYGLSSLVQTDSDSYLETINLGGMPIGFFSDPYQNLSRNVAIIDMALDSNRPTPQRKLSWNMPAGTSFGLIGTEKIRCGYNIEQDKLLEGALHYPSDGMIKDANGRLRFIGFNRFSQTQPIAICGNGVTACIVETLKTVQGYWTWQVLNAENGAGVASVANLYVWDILPVLGTGEYWLVFMNNADKWNIGTEDIGSTKHALRDDLMIGLYKPAQNHIIDKQQRIPFKAKPFIKSSDWQLYSNTTASNWPAYRLFTMQSPESFVPDFVVYTEEGLALMSYDGSNWVRKARYTASGTLIQSTLPPSPRPTSTELPTGFSASLAPTAIVTETPVTTAIPSSSESGPMQLPQASVPMFIDPSTKSISSIPALADLTNDTVVDIQDFNILISCLDSVSRTTNCVDAKRADLNGDGKVDGIDYNIFLRDVQLQQNK